MKPFKSKLTGDGGKKQVVVTCFQVLSTEFT